MGKKREVPTPDADGVLRTGIYQRRVVPKHITIEESQKLLLDWFEKPSGARSIRDWLNGHLAGLAKIISPYRDAKGGTEYALDLGDGWQGYHLADDLPEKVLDAIDCQNEIRVMQSHIAEDNSLEGDLGFVVDAAFRLGRMTHKLQIRDFEPLVRAELGRRDRKKGTGALLTDEQWQLVKNYIDRRVRRGLSAAKAAEEASSQLRTGSFNDLLGQAIEIQAGTLANRYSKRNN